MKLAIIIPAYNEEGTLKSVLMSLPNKIEGYSKVISIVIDDGSNDNTFRIAKKHANYAFSHVMNMGVGAATITGIEAAKRLQVDAAMTMDADGQHHPKDIYKILKPIFENKADIVIGTRSFLKKDMPFIKILGNWLMNLLTFIIFQKWVSDSQSGMKAFSKNALLKMKLHSIGYEICSETVGEAKRRKLKVVEIPIKTIYTDYSRAKGQSIINAINIFTKLLAIKISGKK
jgi:glycosyltransferase involved in cell wall biosynthesis